MSHRFTRILKTAGLFACTSLVAVGISMSPGAVTPASAVVCDLVAVGAGGATDGGDAWGSLACGRNASANDSGGGNNSTAIGTESTAVNHATAIGNNSTADGDNSTAVGYFSNANGYISTAIGGGNGVGKAALATKQYSIAIGGGETGEGAFADNVNAIAMGRDSEALGLNSLSVGHNSLAAGENDSAYGFSAEVFADDGTAIGAHTTVGAGHTKSTAIGYSAATTTNNQMVYGTSTETHTMPGITSDLSKSRQSGPLEVVTSDAGGNLATDGGLIFAGIQQNSLDIQQNSLDIESNRRDIKKNREGVAIAASLADPDLVGSESFGLRGTWGNYDGENALGFTGMGVLSRDFMGTGSRLAFGGGIGFGLQESKVGGRAGGQLTW